MNEESALKPFALHPPPSICFNRNRPKTLLIHYIDAGVPVRFSSCGTMCPPAADIGVHWTDEELVVSLDRIVHGSPLPGNVISDINPYNYRPENLPGGIWYFVRLEEKEGTEKGFWRAKGEPCRIYTNPTITGWRTTLEFYEGKPPRGCKTDWLMQEYRITPKGPSENRKLKDSSSLCRVFLLDGQTPKQEKQNLTVAGGADVDHNCQMQVVPPDAKSNSGEGSTRRPQVNKEDNDTGRSPMTERLLPRPAENLLENSYLIEDDYLELRDLESPSFSSDNSSCMTMSSDECFDSLALLQQLDADINEELKRKNADCKFNVSAGRRSNKVFVCPATSGSLYGSDWSELVANENAKTDDLLPHSASKGKLHHKEVSALKTHEINLKSKGELPKSRVGEASSGSHRAATKGERESNSARSCKKKLKKKYLCFLPL